MNKHAWKKFAVTAREEIMRRVTERANDPHTTDCPHESNRFSSADCHAIHETAHHQIADRLSTAPALLEAAAYTWFQRLIVLLCLQGRGVFSQSSDDKGGAHPPGRRTQSEFLRHREEPKPLRHRDLSRLFPTVFAPVDEWIERLLPDDLLPPGSETALLLDKLNLADFHRIELLGWLHQYYMSARKDEIFAEKKRNIKIRKADIPAATQLFTPAWIVQFLVQNSLGRLWNEAYPASTLPETWRYFLDPLDQPPEVEAQRHLLQKKGLRAEEITLLDPSCGAGHILVYAYDLFHDIYREQGHPPSEIPALILQHNLFGLDVDERAVALARFALLMKAHAHCPDVLDNPPPMNILAIREVEDSRGETTGLQVFADAKNFGSLLQLTQENLNEISNPFLLQAELLSRQYDIVVTNPPYMGTKGMNPALQAFVKKHYPRTKMDLFAAFLERMEAFCRPGGFQAAVTMQSWMFLSSFADYREHLLARNSIEHMVHMGQNVMGIAFGTAATIIRRGVTGMKGTYQHIRTSDLLKNGQASPATAEPARFPMHNERFSILTADQFRDIPGAPIAYWAPPALRRSFREHPPLGEIAEPRQGLATGDNGRYVRYWWEVPFGDIGFGCRSTEEAHAGNRTWFPYNKGGPFRKWYGNHLTVIAFDEESSRELAQRGNRLPSRRFYFREGITWSFVNASRFGVRYTPPGFLFDVGGSSLFPEKGMIPYLAAFLNSKVARACLDVLNPTLNHQVGNIRSLPILLDSKSRTQIHDLAEENIRIAKSDWDACETSWEFRLHPLLRHGSGVQTLEEAYRRYERHATAQFHRLHANEEELNRLFLQGYGLHRDITPEVAPDDISLRRPTRETAAQSFLSYAVGCLLGRFEGGADLMAECPRNILTELQSLLARTFIPDTVQENIAWLAESLKRKASASPEARIRTFFEEEFIDYHTRLYQKRPIYAIIPQSNPHKLPSIVYTGQKDSLPDR